MAYQSRVSDAVVRRLPVYYRHLLELEKNGVERISSRELGERMNYTASQIRQDINCFGGFGQQGYGYHVASLRQHIAVILGIDKAYKAVIAGAGNIGRAVAGYKGFERDGFTLVGIFDKDPAVVGTKCGSLMIQPFSELEGFLKKNTVDVGVIAVPSDVAQQVADQMVRGGVRALWNFAPVDIQHPDSVVSTHVHLSDSLHILTYKMNEESLFKNIDARQQAEKNESGMLS